MNRHVARSHVRRALLSLSLFALLSIPAFSQTLGEITGRVTDASSAGVPGATITLTNRATNAVRTTVSTGAGDYTIPSVPPGFPRTGSPELNVAVSRLLPMPSRPPGLGKVAS